MKSRKRKEGKKQRKVNKNNKEEEGK